MKRMSIFIMLGVLFSCVAPAFSQAEARSGTVVDYKELIPFLPKTLGDMNHDGEPDGSTLRFGEVATTEVSQEYSAGNTHGSVTIASAGELTDSGMLEGVFMDFDYDSPEGYQKSMEIQGCRTVVAYDKIDKKATVVIYAGKFVITAEAYGVEDAEGILTVAENIDLAALAKLGE